MGVDAAQERAEGHAAALSLSETCKHVRDSLGGEGIGVEGELAERAANAVSYHAMLLEDIAEANRKRLKCQVALRYRLENKRLPKHKQIAMKNFYRKYKISRQEFMEGLRAVDRGTVRGLDPNDYDSGTDEEDNDSDSE